MRCREKNFRIHLIPIPVCPSPQAYCLNTLFYLFQTKSIFRPTSSHWISTFYSSLESPYQKQPDCTTFAKKFCTDFCTAKHLKEICKFSVFLEYTFRLFKICRFKFARSRDFQKCIFFCNLRNFLHNFCFLTKYRNKYLDFCKFVIFLQIVEVEPKGFTKTYLMIDLYHNKKIEGGFDLTPIPPPGTPA